MFWLCCVSCWGLFCLLWLWLVSFLCVLVWYKVVVCVFVIGVGFDRWLDFWLDWGVCFCVCVIVLCCWGWLVLCFCGVGGVWWCWVWWWWGFLDFLSYVLLWCGLVFCFYLWLCWVGGVFWYYCLLVRLESWLGWGFCLIYSWVFVIVICWCYLLFLVLVVLVGFCGCYGGLVVVGLGYRDVWSWFGLLDWIVVWLCGDSWIFVVVVIDIFWFVLRLDGKVVFWLVWIVVSVGLWLVIDCFWVWLVLIGWCGCCVWLVCLLVLDGWFWW